MEYKFKVGEKVEIRYEKTITSQSFNGRGTVLAAFMFGYAPCYSVHLELGNATLILGDIEIKGLTLIDFSEMYLHPLHALDIGEHKTTVLDKNTIQVGCQTITRSKIETLLKAMDAAPE